MTGWDQDFLQQAVDTCTNPSGQISDCAIFDIQSEAEQKKCQMKLPQSLAEEKCEGKVGMSLPGNVAIQYGPQPATMVNPPPQTATVAVPTVSYSPGATGAEESQHLPGQVFITKAAPPSITAEAVVAHVKNPAPETTEAPSSTTDDGLPVVSTQYITDGDVVSEIIWKEAVVYVTEHEDTTTTVTVAPSAVAKKVRHERHLHRHHGPGRH